jgi:hypothetical protein
MSDFILGRNTFTASKKSIVRVLTSLIKIGVYTGGYFSVQWDGSRCMGSKLKGSLSALGPFLSGAHEVMNQGVDNTHIVNAVRVNWRMCANKTCQQAPKCTFGRRGDG